MNWKIFGVFLAMILVVWGGYKVWDGYFSETAKLQKAAEDYKKAEQAYIEAMTADTYGGKTPQETLDLFVAALRKGDIELASQYFLLDENLSRERWVKALDGLLKTNKMDEFIVLLFNAKPAGSVMEGYFGFEIRGVDGKLIADLNMRINQLSGLWKIESI